MKVPLRYQVAEYDCAPTSLLNAFSFLYDLEDIPGEIVKTIHDFTLDRKGKNGNLGTGGTSREAITKLSNWLNKFAIKNNFNLKSEKLDGREVTLDKIKDCLTENGCIFVRCWQSCAHYVIVTKVDQEYVYVFDPYYVDKNKYPNSANVKFIINKPFAYNRKVSISRFLSETELDFALGQISKRECLLINKIKRGT